ncbi:His-Xaa-Ser system protein HxsD [Noviherbaspirillum soli]|uniref:His-Xaa-Ser system protein HxsD n=1 Tax=Noviherbaspirillum soli TaxID=1064518 RepID=UPI00188A0EC4|nr:His-Xaa-Ser system protein HxsD [Noviherbaspirillum soli]
MEFDANAFSLLAIQKACHRFTAVASFGVNLQSRDGKNCIIVTASPLGMKSEEGLDHLGKLLRNEALDQQLREQIRIQTEGVRNLILAHAFSKTGLIAPDGAAPAV